MESNRIIITGDEGEALQKLEASEHRIINIEQEQAQKELYKKQLIREGIIERQREQKRDALGHVRTVNVNVKEVSKHMSLVESGAMFTIMLHLQMNSNGVAMKDSKAITMQDLEKLLGKGKTQVSKIVKRLEELSLVYRVREGKTTSIVINDEFHFMGARKGVYTTKVYKKKAQTLLGRLTLQELGVLYKIQHMFHWEHMVLCSNPDEVGTGYIEAISLGELADEVKVDRKTLERIMPKLVSKNVLMKTLNGSRTSYIVNPNYFFRRELDTELTSTIRAVFDSEEMKHKDKEQL